MPDDAYYMRMARSAATGSKDHSRKVGAVVVGPEGEIRSTGYNGLPRRLNDLVPARHERPAKYFWAEHAERNALYFAARVGSSVSGCTMYVWADRPVGICADCMRGLIQSGVKCVVMRPEEPPYDDWMDSTRAALEMMDEAGIVLRSSDCGEG